MATKQVQITDRLLVYDIHTTITENQLRKELLPTYRGIKHIQRLYNTDDNGHKTLKELVQIEFTSPKYTETFLQGGFIKIGNLRCKVKALKPSRHLQNQLESNNGSYYQSEIFTEEQQVTDKILVHDVPTTITENDFGEELSKIYPGVKHVKQWYDRNESKTPTTRVQIDFMSPEDAESILQNGFIQIGQLCCSVTALKSSKRLQKQLDSDYGSDYQSEIYTAVDQVTDKIIICNVSTAINENILGKELSKTYSGMKQITRWCFDDRCQFLTVCVQVDFISPKYTEAILRDGFIVYGNIHYEVKALKSSMSLRNELESDSGSDYQSQIFTD